MTCPNELWSLANNIEESENLPPYVALTIYTCLLMEIPAVRFSDVQLASPFRLLTCG